MMPKRSSGGGDGGNWEDDKNLEEKEEGNGSDIRLWKRHRSVPDVMGEVLRLPSAEVLSQIFEPFLRRVVREEVNNTVFSLINSGRWVSYNQALPSFTRHWRLRFLSKLPHTLFAGTKIEGNDCFPVKVAIIDSLSDTIVTSGQLSSIKVEVLVLDGDFGADEHENWSEEEFNNNLVRQREGKRPLLIGDLVMTLTDGTGYVGDITFTDNSSWIRSRKFRLGLRAFNSPIGGIQEAISTAFLVKDHRGELHKKHHPPLPGDEVWRLEKIRKDGAFHRRLAENGINTVHDFLKQLVIDEERLREILSIGISNRIWDTTVQHALDCVIENDKFYYYRNLEKHVTLFFDSIFQVVGVMFDGCCSLPLSELSPEQKELVNTLSKVAYMNQDDMIETNHLPRNVGLPLLTADITYFPISSFPHHSHQNELTIHTTPPRAFNHTSENFDNPSRLNENPNMGPLFPSVMNQTSDQSDFADPLMYHDSTVRMDCLQFPPVYDLEDERLTGRDIPHLRTLSSARRWFRIMAGLKCGLWFGKKLEARRKTMRRHAGFQTQTYSRFPINF